MDPTEGRGVQLQPIGATASADGFVVVLAVPSGAARLPDVFVIEPTVVSGEGGITYQGATYVEDWPVSELSLHFRSTKRPTGPIVIRIDAIRTDPSIDDRWLREIGLRRSAMEGLPLTISVRLEEEP